MANRPKKPITASAIGVTLMALVVTLAILALSRMPPDGLSNFLSSLFSARDDTPLSPEQQAYETLFAELAMPETAAPRPIDAPSLEEAFTQFAFVEEYSQVYTVRYADGTREQVQTVSLNRTPEAYTLVVYDGDTPDAAHRRMSLRQVGKAFRVEDAQGNEHRYPVGEDFPFASVAMQPDPARLIDDLKQYLQSPESYPASSCEATLADSDHGRLLTLKFVNTAEATVAEYHYLLDYGILFAATEKKGDLVYYRLETTSFSMVGEVEGEE